MCYKKEVHQKTKNINEENITKNENKENKNKKRDQNKNQNKKRDKNENEDKKRDKNKNENTHWTHSKNPTGHHPPPYVKGGDYFNCLNNNEIDIILSKTIKEEKTPAINFYLYRTGKMEKDAFKKVARGYIPLHIYNHWLMGYLIKEENHILVWDSAPSKVVRKTILNIFNQLNWQATFLISPKQLRDSNECGLFAIRAAVRHQAGLTCGSGWLSLAEAREPALAGDITKLRKIFCAPTCGGGSGPEWPLGRPWRSREEGLRYAEALRANARGEEVFFYEDNSGENRDDPIVVEDDEEEDNVDITLRVIEEAQKDTREREQRKKENREKEEKAQQVSVTKQDKRAETGNVQGHVLPQNGHTRTAETGNVQGHVLPQNGHTMKKEEKAPQVSVTKQEERTETGNVQGQVLPQSEHTMTEEEIAESIKTLKEGDKVEVIWLDGDDEITWHGHIVKKTRKRCTVLFDTTDGQVECLLPDDNVDYVRIRNPRHDDAESEDEMERSWSTISTNEEENKTTGVHTAATTTTTAAPAPQTTRRPTPATTTAVTTREHKPGNLWPEWCSTPTEPLLGGETWPVHPRNWFIYAGRPPHVQSLAWSALSEDTRRLHVKWLHRLKAMPISRHEPHIRVCGTHKTSRGSVVRCHSPPKRGGALGRHQRPGDVHEPGGPGREARNGVSEHGKRAGPPTKGDTPEPTTTHPVRGDGGYPRSNQKQHCQSVGHSHVAGGRQAQRYSWFERRGRAVRPNTQQQPTRRSKNNSKTRKGGKTGRNLHNPHNNEPVTGERAGSPHRKKSTGRTNFPSRTEKFTTERTAKGSKGRRRHCKITSIHKKGRH